MLKHFHFTYLPIGNCTALPEGVQIPGIGGEQSDVAAGSQTQTSQRTPLCIRAEYGDPVQRMLIGGCNRGRRSESPNDLLDLCGTHKSGTTCPAQD